MWEVTIRGAPKSPRLDSDELTQCRNSLLVGSDIYAFALTRARRIRCAKNYAVHERTNSTSALTRAKARCSISEQRRCDSQSAQKLDSWI